MPSTGQPSLLSRLAAALRFPAPLPKQQLPPVNQSVPPFGDTQSANRQGLASSVLEDVRSHQVVQHPNILHQTRPGASPFIESNQAANGYAGRARHSPAFSGARTLSRPVKK